MITPRDWTLLVIAEAGTRSVQPVQLQKSLFLISQNLKKPDLTTDPDHFYLFRAYDYGPFCGAVYDDAEILETEGLVEIQHPPATRYKLYRITPSGTARASELRLILSKQALDYLGGVVKFTQNVSFNDLVSAIYKAYPEMRENSVFKGGV